MLYDDEEKTLERYQKSGTSVFSTAVRVVNAAKLVRVHALGFADTDLVARELEVKSKKMGPF